ncbi:DNA polymerase III subunit chi [Gynuella sunshinyii]|uniref:DNA polymerase III, chi subunit n=1 Tax=Gynuella sunshinyii YC6258 TaxID=1445510 RepID=A0A0C5V639_9GAMM|nr:DNA polymerase III subunit chi [Gynuella sunshinyii]AJQ94925.1 DNA polymerase III, chi subunit [Gynuella sunshinyii YC6258]
MTRVDFHILASSSIDDRVNYCCRLVDKIHGLGHRILICVDDAHEAGILDTRLWDFKPESFIPHGIIEPDSGHPIEITWQDNPHHHNNVIVNMGQNIPEFFSRFERYIEVVCQQPEILTNSRKHYRFFQQRGYPLHRHDLRK